MDLLSPRPLNLPKGSEHLKHQRPACSISLESCFIFWCSVCMCVFVFLFENVETRTWAQIVDLHHWGFEFGTLGLFCHMPNTLTHCRVANRSI